MLKRFRFEIVLAAALLLPYAGFWLWQTPGLIRGGLTPGEIDTYLAAIDRNLRAPVDVKSQLTADLRAWSASDDAKPFYMINLMRYYDELQPIVGAPVFGAARKRRTHTTRSS